MDTQKDITKMSIDELKILAYDTSAQLNLDQQNLHVLNQAITARQQQQIKEIKDTVSIDIKKTIFQDCWMLIFNSFIKRGLQRKKRA